MLTTVGPTSFTVARWLRPAWKRVRIMWTCARIPFMRATIDAHEARAKETGARIVFSTGFDSVPFDLGVLFLQTRASPGGKLPSGQGAGTQHERHLLRRHPRLRHGHHGRRAGDPQVLQLLLTP